MVMTRSRERARDADEMEHEYDFRGIALHCTVYVDQHGPVSIKECLFDGDDFDTDGLYTRDKDFHYRPLTVDILHDAHIAWESGK